MEKAQLSNKKLDWSKINSDVHIRVIENVDKLKKGETYLVNPIKAQLLVMLGKAQLI